RCPRGADAPDDGAGRGASGQGIPAAGGPPGAAALRRRGGARPRLSSAPSRVGGDWSAAFCLPDGSLAVATGDVVGHDLEAAATMGQVRNALRAYAFGDDSSAEVLVRLNPLSAALDETRP